MEICKKIFFLLTLSITAMQPASAQAEHHQIILRSKSKIENTLRKAYEEDYFILYEYNYSPRSWPVVLDISDYKYIYFDITIDIPEEYRKALDCKIVKDEIMSSLLKSTPFESLEYSIPECGSIEEALSKIKSNWPDYEPLDNSKLNMEIYTKYFGQAFSNYEKVKREIQVRCDHEIASVITTMGGLSADISKCEELSPEINNSNVDEYLNKYLENHDGFYAYKVPNRFGDEIYRLDGTRYSPGDNPYTDIPWSIAGCKNPKAIRDTFMTAVFGQQGSDMKAIIKDYLSQKEEPEPKRPENPNVELVANEHFVEFGTKDKLFVFDRESGNQITINDIVTNKKGFMEHMNTFDLAIGPFLTNSQKPDEIKKFGSALLIAARYSRRKNPEAFTELPEGWISTFKVTNSSCFPIEIVANGEHYVIDMYEFKEYLDPKFTKRMEKCKTKVRDPYADPI